MQRTLFKLRSRIIAISMVMICLLLVAVLVLVGWSTHDAEKQKIDNALDTSLNLWLELPFDNRPERANYVPVVCVITNSLGYSIVTEQTNVDFDEKIIMDAVEQVNLLEHDAGELTDVHMFFKRAQVGDQNRIAFASSAALKAQTWDNITRLVVFGLAALLVLLLICIYLSCVATSPVKKAWQRERQFIQDASHELRTPLAVIMANISLLQNTSKPSKASQKWLNAAKLEAENMQELVTGMLDLTKSDELLETAAVQSRIDADMVDLVNLLKRVTLQFEALFYEKGLKITSTLQDGIIWQGSAKELEQIMSILLENAGKYATPETDVALKLHYGESKFASSLSCHRTAVITLSNQTSSIEQSDIEHIFERFYRADKSRSSSSEHVPAVDGFGIGLAMAQRLAMLNKIKLTAKLHQNTISFMLQFNV